MKNFTKLYEYLINKPCLSKKILLILLFCPILTFSQWNLVGLSLDGESAGDRSGYTVKLSSDGNVLAIAAPYNDENGNNTGHIRVYENVSGVWRQIGDDIDGAVTMDYLGGFDLIRHDAAPLSLSSDGSVIAIGAPHSVNFGPGSESGRVEVYANISGTWTQVGQDILGGGAFHWLGFSVDLNSEGNILAVGARQSSSNTNFGGYARIYELISGVWTPLGGIISAEALEDGFGASISINADGNIVVIGAPLNDGGGLQAGHVRVYQFASNTWSQIGSDIDGVGSSRTGTSVSINEQGNIIAIGAAYWTGNTGRVRVYELVSNNWSQVGSDINGTYQGHQLGISVALSSSGNRVVIGAKGGSGQTIVYDNISGLWTQAYAEINGTAAGNEFGSSVSISGNGYTVAAGAPKNATNGIDSGQVRVYVDQNSLGIDDINLNNTSISIFPNPTNNYFEIESKETLDKVEIYSLQGQAIKSFMPQNQYDISDLSSGIYFVKIKANTKEITKRIIKE